MAELLMQLIATDDDGGEAEVDADQLRPVLQTELVVRSSS